MRPSTTLSTPSELGLPEAPSLNPARLISLVLLAAILLVGPCLLGAVRPWAELPILGGIVILLLIQAGRLTVRPPLGSLRQIDAIDLSVVLFTAYTILRWLTSATEYFSRFEMLSVIGYATVFLFCRYGLVRRKHGVTLIVLLAALGAGEVIFGYLLHLHSNTADPSSLWFPFGPSEQMHLYWAPRWVGTYGCPNNYACFLVMCTGAALGLGCFSRYPWPARIVFFYIAALLQVAILYSQSRGSWLSLIGAVAALIYFGVRYASLRWWIPVISGSILAGILVTIFLSSHMVERRAAETMRIVHGGALNRYMRVQLTEDALRIAHDHPLFGTGPATFTFVDPSYEAGALAAGAVFTHDDYLNCLDDYGLIGFGIAMFFATAVTLSLFTRAQLTSRWTEKVLVATALLAWCALLVHSLFDFNLHIPANAMILFSLAGMALSRRPGEDAPYHWSTISLVRFGPALGWTLAVFGLLYGAEITRSLLSDLPYESAVADADVAPTIQSIQGAEQALSFDSGNAQALIMLGDLRRLRASRADTVEDRTTEATAALDAYQRALKANPLDNIIRADLGQTYEQLEKYPDAYRCYETVIAAEPYNGQFWMDLATYYFGRGLYEKAENAYLFASTCSYGSRGAAQSAKGIRTLLLLKNFLPAKSAPALTKKPMIETKASAPELSPTEMVSPPEAVTNFPAPASTPAPPPSAATPSPQQPAERPEPATQP